MNIDHYQEFRDYEEKGLKKQASESLRSFISSFKSENEIEEWVWEYLPKIETNRHSRIRHELFHELIYPVLKRGYENGEFRSSLWLGKLVQNIYQSKKIHEELGWITEEGLYNKCYELNPSNDEARLLLLKSIISWFEFSEHEWPSGILYGNNGATIEQCDEIATEILKAKNLDKESRFSGFIDQYNKKLGEYRARLNKTL
jgi:hypothetical protein